MQKDEHLNNLSTAHLKIEGDPGMAGLKEGDAGFWEAKSNILEKRLVALAKTEYWLRAVSF
jgi:hypothetical protein